MSMWLTEGFVKTVSRKSKNTNEIVSITIDAVPPYLFVLNKQKDDGKPLRFLILTEGGLSDNKMNTSKIVKEDGYKFLVGNVDFAAMLIAKANHLRMRLLLGDVRQKEAIVSSFDIL